MKFLLPFLCFAVFLTTNAFAQADAPGSWPGWRGADRTDRSTETGLLKSWPDGGPQKVWTAKFAGIGYAGFAIDKGILYTMGADDDSEFLLALDANTGAAKWKTPLGGRLENGWGDGPRGTPALDGGGVYALAAEGNLVCANAATGREIWRASLTEAGGDIPRWGYSESPLIEGEKVIVTPGGRKGAVLALNKKTGEKIWQSADFTDPAHYSSCIAADHHGKRQIIQLVQKNVVGLDATNGDVLWTSDWPGKVAVIPTPIFDDGKVFVTTGYSVGCKLIDLGANTPRVVWQNKHMKNHHGGVIKHGDHLYGYSDGYGWTCLDWKTGEIAWSNKKVHGKGSIAYADDRFYCLDERTGEVALIKATPDGWDETGRLKITPQTALRKPKGRIWTHPVILDGKLYLRDQEIVLCYDISAP